MGYVRSITRKAAIFYSSGVKISDRRATSVKVKRTEAAVAGQRGGGGGGGGGGMGDGDRTGTGDGTAVGMETK